MAKVGEIADDLDVIIEWNFTAAGHSKGKHDAEGHVIKTEIRSAILSGAIRFNKPAVPYSVTIINHLSSHFHPNNPDHKFNRYFFSIPENTITNIKAGDTCKTLTGISSYHCFLICFMHVIVYVVA